MTSDDEYRPKRGRTGGDFNGNPDDPEATREKVRWHMKETERHCGHPNDPGMECQACGYFCCLDCFGAITDHHGQIINAQEPRDICPECGRVALKYTRRR